MPLICLFGFVFTTFTLYLWSITEQTYGNMESICRTLSIEKAPCEQDLILSNRWKKKESSSRVDKSLCKLIMITKEKMLWSFIKWKWVEIGMDNYCVRGVFLNFSCWQISWSRKSFSIILKMQLKKDWSHIEYPEKTAVISRSHHWFPREVTS